MTAIVLRGDAAHLPLPDASVDLIVTSPPYFGLRSYTDGGAHYDGQIGSEATPAAYVAALVDCTREWMRVLKPSGSLFVNLGDKYAGSDGTSGGSNGTVGGGQKRNALDKTARPRRDFAGIPTKSLIGLPWRYALACIDDLGLILRAEVIWSKPNGLPESVTDRVRRSHEQLFHFTRLPRYYSAVAEIRDEMGRPANSTERRLGTRTKIGPADAADGVFNRRSDWIPGPNPLGKLPGSVWDIPSQPLTVPPSLGVDHFAAFPMELPRRIVLGWSPPGICVACGEGRRPVVDKALIAIHGYDTSITGYACACPEEFDYSCSGCAGTCCTGIGSEPCTCQPRPKAPAPTRPAVVLDPFGGTGTTALIADAYGRTGISIDRSNDYCRLATWRTQDPAQRAAALQVPKPPTQVNGQLDMYALTD